MRTSPLRVSRLVTARSMTFCNSRDRRKCVTPDDLADLLPDTPATESGESEGGFHEAVRQARRRLIATALEQASGNVTEAAHALKLHPNYLHRLITNLGLRSLTSGV